MSKWYQPTIKDISINEIEPDELSIYLDSDDFGAIWVAVKIKDIKKILNLEEPSK